jgi:F-type H+-transporting ATPase subunit delta
MERTTLARPYAEAVFRLARERQALAPWSEMLGFAAAVVRDPQMSRLIDNPRVPRERFVSFFLDVCGKKIDKDGGNFIRVLVENRRIQLLPEIAELYEALRAGAEARVEAEVVSATAVGAEQLKAIAAALKKRLGRDVTLATRLDPSLVGGIVIRAGDLVIDGSVRGKLDALATHLTK